MYSGTSVRNICGTSRKSLVVKTGLVARSVNWRVGEDDVGLVGEVAVVVEGVTLADLTVDAADTQVHLGPQPPP
jgi:hypothetical protein